MTTYYLAKYALGDGKITTIEWAKDPDEDGDIFFNGGLLRLGRDIFLTKEDAVAAADKLRLKKIASLKKQIATLEAMRF